MTGEFSRRRGTSYFWNFPWRVPPFSMLTVHLGLIYLSHLCSASHFDFGFITSPSGRENHLESECCQWAKGPWSSAQWICHMDNWQLRLRHGDWLRGQNCSFSAIESQLESLALPRRRKRRGQTISTVRLPVHPLTLIQACRTVILEWHYFSM